MHPLGSKERSHSGCMCRYCKPKKRGGTKDRYSTRIWKRSERQKCKARIKKEKDNEES